MPSCRLLGVVIAVSIVAAASAQTPAPKAKPAKKPATPAKAAEKTKEPDAPAHPTDIKIRTKYVDGALVSENTTYFKGPRQRFEFPGITLITQCDLNRSLQLHDATKRFMVMPTVTEAPVSRSGADNSAAAPAPQKGGVIAETITLTDTGERKQMFGLEARHIKTVAARQPGTNSCDPRATRVETDGWYADLPQQAACPAVPAQAPPTPTAGPPACTDRVDTQQLGTAKLGFALSTAITTTVEQGKEKEVTTMAVEITALQVTSLPAALFDVPSGYAEVKSYQELLPSIADGGSLAAAVFGSLADGTSTVASKQPGVIRIGVVDPTNKSGRTLPTPVLRGSLIASLHMAPFEALPVAGATPADLDRDAADKSCDFVLVADVAELKTSKPGKVGGMLRRASGDATAPGEIHDARVDYKLYAVGDETNPKMTASAKASSGGGFGVGSALRVAAFAGSMYMTMGMGSGMMMGMMSPGSSIGAIGGLGGGGLSGLMNPGMGAAMSMMSRAQMMGGAGVGVPGGVDPSGDQSSAKATQTVQEALSRAGRHVAEQLKAGKLQTIQEKR